jgi:hypothetical protein
MNKKETAASLAIVGMALLATITMISPTQALALGHWNLNEDFPPNSDVVEDGEDSSGTSDNTEEGSGHEEEEDGTTSATADEDEEEEKSSEENSSDKEGSSSSGYEAFQDCLAEIEESPTEDQVQNCIQSSYDGQDDSEDAPSESADDEDEGNTDVTQEYEPRTVS